MSTAWCMTLHRSPPERSSGSKDIRGNSIRAVMIMNYVQAYISNISFPTSLDEVYKYAHLFNMEMILGCDFYNLLNDKHYMDFNNVEKYESRKTEWTAPKWCKSGDIVLFMHSKTANARISAMKTELLSNRDKYTDDAFWIMMNALTRARKIYEIYGGKIFAIGKINGTPIYDSADTDQQHWKSKIYAPIDSIFLLEKPIDISEFNAVIMVSRQSSITPVFGEQFTYLKELILKKNPIVEEYYKESAAEPVPLARINDENWLNIVNNYRRSFFLEIQFRSFYVDRFLKYLGDTRTIFRECACIKTDVPTSYVDNVIKLDGFYLPVEVKLSVDAEQDILAQLRKYCNLNHLMLTKNRIINSGLYDNNVLVIDTERLYMYNNRKKALNALADLDSIHTIEDIANLRQTIIQKR